MTMFHLQTFDNGDVFALHGTPTPPGGSYCNVWIWNANVCIIIQIQLSFDKASDDQCVTRVRYIETGKNRSKAKTLLK